MWSLVCLCCRVCPLCPSLQRHSLWHIPQCLSLRFTTSTCRSLTWRTWPWFEISAREYATPIHIWKVYKQACVGKPSQVSGTQSRQGDHCQDCW
jgi:hypothetical protein